MEVHLTTMTFCQVNCIFPYLYPCRFVLPGPKMSILIVRMLEFTTGSVELLKILYHIVGPWSVSLTMTWNNTCGWLVYWSKLQPRNLQAGSPLCQLKTKTSRLVELQLPLSPSSYGKTYGQTAHQHRWPWRMALMQQLLIVAGRMSNVLEQYPECVWKDFCHDLVLVTNSRWVWVAQYYITHVGQVIWYMPICWHIQVLHTANWAIT